AENAVIAIVSFTPVVFVARLVLGFLFALAGISKATARKEFEKTIARYEILPPTGAVLVSLVLPWVEFSVGVLLLIGAFMPLAAAVTAILLFGFIVIAILNAIRGKEPGCGCFGPHWRAREGWLSVAVRDAALLVVAIYLIVSYLLLSHPAPATSLVSIAIGVIFLAIAILIGLPLPTIGAQESTTGAREEVSDRGGGRRRFFRYAAAVAGGTVAGALLDSPSRNLAQAKDTEPSQQVIEHEVKLTSLSEATERAPHPILIPRYVPSDYSLEMVGAFTRGVKEHHVREVILHYGKDAYHRLTIQFSPKREHDSEPNFGSVLSKLMVRGQEAVLWKSFTSRNRIIHTLWWRDRDWEISVIGMNVSENELFAVSQSL
ncbi:MAG: DoxX family membrane protein, partial [Anaerolineae bacterium]|nr:DoxX family membrane protein [Anaerolineae bacterium]